MHSKIIMLLFSLIVPVLFVWITQCRLGSGAGTLVLLCSLCLYCWRTGGCTTSSTTQPNIGLWASDHTRTVFYSSYITTHVSFLPNTFTGHNRLEIVVGSDWFHPLWCCSPDHLHCCASGKTQCSVQLCKNCYWASSWQLNTHTHVQTYAHTCTNMHTH